MQSSRSYSYDAYHAQPSSPEDRNIQTTSEPFPPPPPHEQSHLSFYNLGESSPIPYYPPSDPHQLQHVAPPHNSHSRGASTGGRMQGGQYGTPSPYPGEVAQSDTRHPSSYYHPPSYPQLSATSSPHSPVLPYQNSVQPSRFIHTASQVPPYPNYHSPTPSQHSPYQSGAVPGHSVQEHPMTNASASRHSYSSPMTSTPRPIRHADTASSSHSRSNSATVTSPMQGERFLCQVCGNTFSRAHDRKRHHETHHLSNPAVHRCPCCDKEFSRGDSLKRHTDNGCRDSEC